MQKKTIVKDLLYWNKKVHIHLGLGLLLFLWLFSLSGLLLNHSNWKFASFWEQRKENKKTLSLTIPSDLDSAGLIMLVKQKMNTKGEVSEVQLNPDSLDFRAAVPGHLHDIHVDFKKGIVTDKEMRYNVWGILRTLHTSNAVDKNNPSRPSNWWVSALWRLTMDAVAISLILICVSSYVMWYRLGKGRVLGFVLLTIGLLGAVYFVWLL